MDRPLDLRGAAAVGCVILLLAGCGQREAGWEPTMENPPVREVPVSATPRCVSQLGDDDVVVAVNGIALTKREVDLRLRRVLWTLANSNFRDPRQAQAMYKSYGKNLISQFVRSQLLAWEGRRLKLLDREAVIAGVEKGVKQSAKTYRRSVEKLGREMPGGLDALKRSIEEGLWCEAYVKREVKPDQVVDEAFVSNLVAAVDAENAAAAVTNGQLRAELARIRAEIVADVASSNAFGKAADKYDQYPPQEKDGSGEWGILLASELDEAVREDIVALKKGEMSGVLEDEEGFCLVKMLDLQPAVRNASGQIEKPAAYRLGRIFLPKVEMTTLAYDPKTMKKQLAQEALMRGVLKRAEELMRTAQIVYPNGTNFWDTASAKKAPKRKGKTVKGAKTDAAEKSQSKEVGK